MFHRPAAILLGVSVSKVKLVIGFVYNFVVLLPGHTYSPSKILS